MSATAVTRYDVVEHLRTPEEMAAYLEVCLEEALAMPVYRQGVGRYCPRQGQAQGTKDAGLSRESLDKTLFSSRTSKRPAA